MRVEDCIVEVRRRSAGSCLDLACVFVREFAIPLFQLTAWFAIPSLVLTWWILSLRPGLMLEVWFLWSLLLALYSGALVGGMGGQVFGQPFSPGRCLTTLGSRLPLYLVCMILVRMVQYLLSFCLLFPALLIVPWTGFLAEVIYLERTPARQLTQRVGSLVAGGNGLRIYIRLAQLLVFGLIATCGLYLGLVFLLTFAFNMPWPVFAEGIGGLGPPRILREFLGDPWNAVLIQTCLWFATPLCRLTWFFFYLDGRIRQECWDLDVAFQVEAKRLEEAVA